MPRTAAAKPPPNAPGLPEDWQQPVGGLPATVEPDEEIEETAEDRVSIMLRDARADQSARVRLYRVQPGTKKLAWCADYTPDEFEAGGFDMVRAAWGAGSYEIRLYGTTMSGAFGVVRRSPLDIVERMNAPAAQVGGGLGELAQILQAMNAQNAQAQAAILEALNKRPDPMASMKETLTLMGLFREAMGGGAKQEKTTIGELVDALKELRGASDLIGGDKFDSDSPFAALPGLLEVIKQGMATQQQAPAVVGIPQVHAPAMIARAQPIPSVVPLGYPANPEPGPFNPHPLSAEHQQAIVENPAVSAAQQQEVQQMQELFAALAELVKMAETGGDVEDAAELVYDKLPDELVAMLQTEEWFDTLRAVVPSIDEKHREYFGKVRTRALGIFAEESQQPVGQS